MIKQFKKKTATILLLILWGVLWAILITLNLYNYHANQVQARNLLLMQERITNDTDSNKEDQPPIVNGQQLTHIYTVQKVSGEYAIVYPKWDNNEEEDGIVDTAKAIEEEGSSEGFYNQYKFRIEEEGNATYISFLDYSLWAQQQYRMLIYSGVICGIGMVLLFFLAVYLSEWLTRPVREAFERQKQFISDAGHELKTPLSVVRASLELLENDVQDNKYVNYIRNENDRMTELAHELLLLTNLEDRGGKECHVPIEFGHSLTGACLPFESIAFEQGVSLVLNIEKDIYIVGEEKQLRKMVEVLLDNAMKHVKQKGTVMVRLKKEKGKAVLTVENEGEEIPKEIQEKIFDRFYRGDQARERKEGRYGLGLAIASAIVESHKGKISVESQDGKTAFIVKLPVK